MEIAELRIEGFRGINVGSIRFGPHTVLVGSNNCGKTTIIEAMALLFGRDRMVRSLTEHDFYGGCPEPADRIRLIATIVGFAGNEPVEHHEWFREDRAIVLAIANSDLAHVSFGRLSPAVETLGYQDQNAADDRRPVPGGDARINPSHGDGKKAQGHPPDRLACRVSSTLAFANLNVTMSPWTISQHSSVMRGWRITQKSWQET
ncbi:ATP-dependent nuclease [Mesorhizobium sp. A623]